jgi:serine/threonine protein kinase
MNNLPRKLGRYQIIRELGRGAMGVVYKAYDPVIEREVAIKAIQLAFQVSGEEKKVFLDRFFREAKAAGKLNHPNIVTIYDVDEDKETGTPFIVMEFLEGTTLQEIVASGMLLPLEDVNGIIIQLADALNYAHSQGVVHRDVKVGNILILQGMKSKIMDFGIARMDSSDLTRSGQFIGTPNYMSPEQVDGKTPVDGRSDLFSLGVIFYLLLTGERPFSGDSFTAISYKIVHVDPIPPRTINPVVPEPYNKILSRVLAKEPEKRYQTGMELISDLRKLEGASFEEVEELPAEDVAVISEDTPAPPVRAIHDSQTTITQIHDTGLRRLTLVAVLVLFAAILMFGGVYYFRTSPQSEARIVTAPSNDSKEISKQNLIRSKWDLAMSYYQNGLYAQCTEQLNDILQIDPGYEDATKFLQLVEQKKKEKEEEQAKLSEPPPHQEPPKIVQPHPTEQSSSPAPQPVAPVVKPSVTPAPAGDETRFQFEHSLPSGILYIYAGEQVLFAGPFSGTKQKFLMITRYKGQLSGSFRIPSGTSKLRVHLMCKELGVSAYKEIEIMPEKVFKITYTAKELQVRWTQS